MLTAGKATLASVTAEADRTPDLANYRERLRTPWWWYPIALMAAAILAAEFHIADETLTDWIPYCALLPFAVAVVWWLGRSELAIEGGELRIRHAHLPLRYISEAISLDSTTVRRVVGRDGDPLAFVSIRPWIGPGVQVLVDDPDDPTPYWVVSTRSPGRVVQLLRAGR
jgi:Protein of unknown function (DUF3093)